MRKQKENATDEKLKEYVDQALQSSTPSGAQQVVLLVALCLDIDPIEVQGYYMDSQYLINEGMRRLVSGQAARDRLLKNNVEWYKPLESDT